MLEFAKSHNLILANTIHNHKISRRTTWHSPGDKYKNQIDYILVQKPYRTSIRANKTRSFPGADIGSDHDLVMMTIQIRLRKNRKTSNPRIKFNLEKLNDPNVRAEFEAKVGGKFALLSKMTEMQEIVDNFVKGTEEVALEVLGKVRKARDPWINNKILDLRDKRRSLKNQKGKSDKKMSEYRTVNSNIKAAIKEAREEWMNKECEKIENSLNNNNSKKAFEIVQKLTKKSEKRMSVIEDKNGVLLTKPEEVCKRWYEYCQELYNYEINTDTEYLKMLKKEAARVEERGDLEILPSEVTEAINSLKNGKAAGIDNIPAELLKAGGEEMHKVMLKICNEAWKKNKWPEQWTKSILIKLPKKGNLKKCKNHRTISLISHPSKVLLRIILSRSKPQIKQIIAEERAGFSKGRSTTEQITNLRILCKKFKEKGKTLYHNFIDYRKAFDRVWQEALWAVMKKHNIDHKLVDMIMALYDDTKSTVQVDNTLTDWFKSTVGVRQGCLLSPYLFNIFLEQIMSEALEGFETAVSINGKPITNLRFADDIALITNSMEKLSELTERLDKASAKMGMEINGEKCKIMQIGKKNNMQDADNIDIQVGNHTIEKVNDFKYLGAYISDNARCEKEIKTRLAMALASMVKYNKIWRNKKITVNTKVRLLKAVITSIALYGCQSWTLSKEMEKRIESFEFKCYRHMLQIPYTAHVANESIKNQIDATTGTSERLLGTVRKRKLQWFGHLVRQDNSLAKMIMEGMVEGKRGRGRPEKQWIDNIKEWTMLEISEIMKKARDREQWRLIVRKASICPYGRETMG